MKEMWRYGTMPVGRCGKTPRDAFWDVGDTRRRRKGRDTMERDTQERGERRKAKAHREVVTAGGIRRRRIR